MRAPETWSGRERSSHTGVRAVPRIRLAKYNCDEASDKAAQYGVRGIPTVIAFKKGEVIDQRTGACDQATLDAFIEKNL